MQKNEKKLIIYKKVIDREQLKIIHLQSRAMFTDHDENDKKELEELIKWSPSNKWPKSKIFKTNHLYGKSV